MVSKVPSTSKCIQTYKSSDLNEKKKTVDLVKAELIYSLKNATKRVKRKAIDGRNTTLISDKGLASRIYKEHLKKQLKMLIRMGKRLE